MLNTNLECSLSLHLVQKRIGLPREVCIRPDKKPESDLSQLEFTQMSKVWKEHVEFILELGILRKACPSVRVGAHFNNVYGSPIGKRIVGEFRGIVVIHPIFNDRGIVWILLRFGFVFTTIYVGRDLSRSLEAKQDIGMSVSFFFEQRKGIDQLGICSFHRARLLKPMIAHNCDSQKP